jgi:hypothetical protein
LGFRQLGQPRYASSPMILVTTSRAARPYTAGRTLGRDEIRHLVIGTAGATPGADVRVGQCLDTMLDLADRFADLTPKQRDRMATTLLVWLQTRGTHREIAARLDVHPQTVRYRIHQLQQLFGDKLTDPDTRLTMELALRAHLLLTPPTPG